MIPGEVLWSISAPHFCAGLIVGLDGRVRQAAPILGWSVGKPWVEVARYFQRKGYEVESVESLSEKREGNVNE
jgi:hypothetical protein